MGRQCAGIAASAALAHLLASLSGQVNPLDGVTMIGIVAQLAAVVAAATLVPGRKAVVTDPVCALRRISLYRNGASSTLPMRSSRAHSGHARWRPLRACSSKNSSCSIITSSAGAGCM